MCVPLVDIVDASIFVPSNGQPPTHFLVVLDPMSRVKYVQAITVQEARLTIHSLVQCIFDEGDPVPHCPWSFSLLVP